MSGVVEWSLKRLSTSVILYMYDIFCTTPLHKKAFKWQLLFRQVRFIISESSTELPTLIQCAFFSDSHPVSYLLHCVH